MGEPALSAAPARAAPRLSAVIITRDEADDLPDCLESLRGVADEVVVLDSGSRDETMDIARRLGARVSSREFDGFGAQKQAALDLATGDWVLSIDADERLTPELAEEIRRAVAAPEADGYWVRRTLTYLGRDLRYGGTERDWVLRLARRSAARFTPVPVHERLEVEGDTRRLRSPMRHVKYATLSEHLATIDRYTDAIADVKRAKGKRFSAWHLLRIPWELFARLVLRLGVLDGRAGIIHAVMASYYGFLKYAKLWPAKPSRTRDAR